MISRITKHNSKTVLPYSLSCRKIMFLTSVFSKYRKYLKFMLWHFNIFTMKNNASDSFSGFTMLGTPFHWKINRFEPDLSITKSVRYPMQHIPFYSPDSVRNSKKAVLCAKEGNYRSVGVNRHNGLCVIFAWTMLYSKCSKNQKISSGCCLLRLEQVWLLTNIYVVDIFPSILFFPS